MITHGTHMRLERDWEGVAWLALDKLGESTNTLSSDVLEELGRVIDGLEVDPPNGLVIASAKPGGFVAGADLDELEALRSEEDARALVELGWNLFTRIARLPFPTLALIRGHCMGGGLELALACSYRVVVDEPATRLALPEVLLGLVPAWGGIRRLPLLVGPAVALDMMLSGRSLSAQRAWRIGLADVCVPARVMENAARRVVMSGRQCRHLSMPQLLMNSVLRPFVASRARKRLAQRVRREHYPAPFAILDIWSRHRGNVLAVAQHSPSSLATLLRSDTARALMRVFRLRERLRRYASEASERDRPIRHVHVIGAGVMGGDIAALCAAHGLKVTLQDVGMPRIAAALGRASTAFTQHFRDDERAVRDASDRLVPDPDGHGLRRADLIIEAIVEDLAAKRSLLARINREARPEALLATNTSSLLIEDIAEVLDAPQRLVGLHFFNPVAHMPLVEVVAGAASDARELERARHFVGVLDRLPLPVASAPGFLVNAALAPYLFEALRCVEEGVSPEAVDEALRAFGMTVGPVELVDRIGLDVALAAGRALSVQAEPAMLLARVAAGDLGRKSGRGYYEWKDGKPLRHESPSASAALANRILAPLLAATRDCVARGVVADDDLADAGLIFGAGFAPFTGGPLTWVAQHPDTTESQQDAPAT